MTEQKYNGWANYPTWAVKLWIDDTQETQEYWWLKAKQAIRRVTSGKCEQVKAGYWNADRAPVYILEDWLKNEYEDKSPLVEDASVWADLIGWALGVVEWREIAEALVEAVKETEEA